MKLSHHNKRERVWPWPPAVVPLIADRSPGEANGGRHVALTFWILVEAGDVHTGIAAYCFGADAPPNLLCV